MTADEPVYGRSELEGMAVIVAVEKFLTLVRATTYKPHWHFQADYDAEYRQVVVAITAPVVDAVTGQPSRVMSRKTLPDWNFNDMRDPEWGRHWIHRQIMEMEAHETAEFLRFEGTRFINPHPELGEDQHRQMDAPPWMAPRKVMVRVDPPLDPKGPIVEDGAGWRVDFKTATLWLHRGDCAARGGDFPCDCRVPK